MRHVPPTVLVLVYSILCLCIFKQVQVPAPAHAAQQVMTKPKPRQQHVDFHACATKNSEASADHASSCRCKRRPQRMQRSRPRRRRSPGSSTWTPMWRRRWTASSTPRTMNTSCPGPSEPSRAFVPLQAHCSAVSTKIAQGIYSSMPHQGARLPGTS